MTAHNTNHNVNLAELGEAELRDVMYARLAGNPSVGPPVDSRIGQEPLEWLSDQYRRGDAGLQHRMAAVLDDFLEELTDTSRWPERARHALLDLIQDCGESLIDHLHRLIRRQTFLKAEGLGPEVHAGLLKCLISNGHHATPDFWLKQSGLLGPPYGALIFSGLVDHGLELAMSHLPELCGHEEAKNFIRWLFPYLQDKFGAAAVLEQLEQVRNRLPVETYQLYRRDLTLPVKSDVASSFADQPPNSGQQRETMLDSPIQSKEAASDPKPSPELVELVIREEPISIAETLDPKADYRVPYFAQWLSTQKLSPTTSRVKLTGIVCSAVEGLDLPASVLAVCWGRHAGALDDCARAADVADKAGWFDRAIASYERSLKLRPDDAATLNNLSATLLRKWRVVTTDTEKQSLLSQAAKSSEKAMELDAPTARYNHACVLALTGKTEQALQELRQVLTENPDKRSQIAEDEDFESLATHPEFRELIAADEAVAVDNP